MASAVSIGCLCGLVDLAYGLGGATNEQLILGGICRCGLPVNTDLRLGRAWRTWISNSIRWDHPGRYDLDRGSFRSR